MKEDVKSQDLSRVLGKDFYDAAKKETLDILKKYNVVQIVENNLKKYSIYGEKYIYFDKDVSSGNSILFVTDDNGKSYLDYFMLGFSFTNYKVKTSIFNPFSAASEEDQKEAKALASKLFKDIINDLSMLRKDSKKLGITIETIKYEDCWNLDFIYTENFVKNLQKKYGFNESFIYEALLPRLHKPKEESIEDVDTEIADGKEIIKYRIKEIVQRYNKTDDIRKKMRKDMDKYININPGNLDRWENTRNVPKLTYAVYEDKEDSISFLIIDDTSFVKESLDGIVKNIRTDLMKCKDIKSLPALANITTGDYGSGIIYVIFKK